MTRWSTPSRFWGAVDRRNGSSTEWSRRGFLASLATPLAAQAPYDLLIQGGHVVDPANGVNEPRDVAIAGGKIAVVAEAIPASKARQVITAKGLYVTPGLIDIHVHAFTGLTPDEAANGDMSLPPDGFTLRSGVTTAVDAGSSGWRAFPEFKKRIIDRSQTRMFAFLNIVGKGMGGRNTVEQDLNDMDPEATARVARQYSDTIVGIKTAHYAAGDWSAVDRAVAAGKLAGIPVMVDYGVFHPDRPYSQLLLDHLRPGDISTHMFIEPAPLLDEKGTVRDYLRLARKRGVKFDVGHGSGSFVWPQAGPLIRQGFYPDSISTDLHSKSMNAGMKDMNNVMSKILALGVPFDQVIRMSTMNPANQIHRPALGRLTPGLEADITVLRRESGEFGYVDSRGRRLAGKERISCELTIRAGRPVWDREGRAAQ